jgi:molybdenum cofactor biosynthesis protein B
VSDTRGPKDDVSGDQAQRLVEAAGHRVVLRSWVRDERAGIRRAGAAALRRRDVDVLIVTGGTGAAPRDVTPEALEPLFTKTLPGFGERFRARSEQDVGTAAWLSRASAGVARGRLLVMLPGSPRGVAMALQQVLLPELGHVLRLIGRTTSGD